MKTGSRKFKALPGNQHKKKRCKRTTPMKKESAGTTMTESSGMKTNKKSGPLAEKYGDHKWKDHAADKADSKKQKIGKKAAREIWKSTKKKKKRISYGTEENVIKITSQIRAPT